MRQLSCWLPTRASKLSPQTPWRGGGCGKRAGVAREGDLEQLAVLQAKPQGVRDCKLKVVKKWINFSNDKQWLLSYSLKFILIKFNVVKENSSLLVPVTLSLTIKIFPDLPFYWHFYLKLGCPTGFQHKRTIHRLDYIKPATDTQFWRYIFSQHPFNRSRTIAFSYWN